MSRWPAKIRPGKSAASSQREGASGRRCPPFDPQVMQRLLGRDETFRWLVVGFLLVLAMGALLDIAAMSSPVLKPASDAWGVVSGWMFPLAMLIAGVWIFVSISSMKVAQQLGAVNAVMDQHPQQAEDVLATLLDKKLLQGSVRLLLYHRLAMLRHRQRCYAEAAAIGEQVLAHPVRQTAHLRSHLLLLVGDARLQCGDLGGAYQALAQLHDMRLRASERLQLLMLQTRYEVLSGHDGAALSDLRRKVQMSELMPATQNGAMHAMLAIAATREGRPTLADWLNRRAQLLCSAKQLEALGEATAVVLEE